MPRRKEVRVTVENNTKGAATPNIGLKVPPAGGSCRVAAPVSLAREGETATVRFTVSPPAAPAIGQLALKAEATGAKAPNLTGSEQFTQGYQVIEYPHIQRRHNASSRRKRRSRSSTSASPHGIKLGYIMGVGDLVPQALDQLGVTASMITPTTSPTATSRSYDTIMLGIRAYERREDLKAYNHRLIKYVNDGGTLIVQYNKTGEFNQAQYGPYPAMVSSNRVTDETAPVTVLVPDHPVFNHPTRSPRWRGTTGCRSAACIFLASAIPDTWIFSRSPTRFRLTPAPSAAPSSRHASAQAAGYTSA